MSELRHLPVPFSAEVGARRGAIKRFSPTNLPDGWYMRRRSEDSREWGFLAISGAVYLSKEYGVGAWRQQLALYECEETCGAKHPDLWEEVLERRSVERQLLWMYKQMEMEEE
jgi:hypothetical protein